mgnify:FL=1
MVCCRPAMSEPQGAADSSAAVNRYPTLHIDVALEESEFVSDRLWELGATGVEERDQGTLDGPSSAQAQRTLVAHFETEDEAQQALRELKPLPGRLVYIEGDDWREGWKQYFHPFRVGHRLWIRPSWEEVQSLADEKIVTIDPGAAFGSGAHESTRLVLKEVERRVLGNERVLDVGCGSGILAIAALMLGARSALGIENDALALEVAQENAAHNGVAERFKTALTPVQRLRSTYDLVLANIEAHVLIPMAEALKKRVAEGGCLVLSGILRHQRDEVLAAYGASLGQALISSEGEWIAIVLHRGREASGPWLPAKTR